MKKKILLGIVLLHASLHASRPAPKKDHGYLSSVNSVAPSCTPSSHRKALDNTAWKKVFEARARGYVAALSVDKRMIVAGGDKNLITIWTADDNGVWSKNPIVLGNTLSKLGLIFSAISLSVDKQMIVAGSTDGLIKIWTADNSGVWSNSPIILDQNLTASSLALSGNKRMIVAAGRTGGLVRVWTADNQGVWSKDPLIWKNPTGWNVNSVVLSLDRLMMVAGCEDGSIAIRAKNPTLADDKRRNMLTLLNKPKELNSTVSVNSVVLSGDKRMIVAGLSSGFIKIFTANNQGMWSDESRILLTPTNLMNNMNAQQITDLSSRSISCVALSADNGMIVAGSKDGSVKIWTLNDQCEWVSSFLVEPSASYDESVTFVDLSPDGSMILVRQADSTLTAWSLVSGEKTSDTNKIK